MKGLILAGGRGKRLGNLTNSMNKCMLVLGGKPVLEYNIERMADLAGIDKIIIVVGHKAEDIINRYGIEFKGKKINYAIQWDPKGLVDAIECASAFIGKDDFFLLLGDEILLNSRHEEMLETYMKEKVFAVCGLFLQKDPRKIGRTYTVLQDGNGRIARLIEKPKKALNNWQGTGHCIFKNKMLNYIKRTPIHPERGEKELPDLVQCAVDDGQIVKSFNICDDYVNINSEKDLTEAQHLIKQVNNSKKNSVPK
jgi:dTDP-glucose pyrophosphorylase